MYQVDSGFIDFIRFMEGILAAIFVNYKRHDAVVLVSGLFITREA
ncbi:hypothetical protein O9993_23240 [Vibrio lentus]|nr:hypothetical protein [Vibrio lentus]